MEGQTAFLKKWEIVFRAESKPLSFFLPFFLSFFLSIFK